jgi:hypothetical protein
MTSVNQEPIMRKMMEKVKLTVRIGLSIVTALCLAGISGCADEESLWKQTESSNTISSYQQFIEQYPDSRHATESKRKIEYLSFEIASAKNNQEAYKEYLENYPAGAMAEEARAKLNAIKNERIAIENKAWSDAVQSNTFKDYAQFHKVYRSSRQNELRQKLLNLVVESNGLTYANGLTDHIAKLSASNAFEAHNIKIQYNNGSTVVIGAGGFFWPYSYSDGIYSTTFPLSSMTFGPELMYIFLSDAEKPLVFKADTQGLRRVSGTGTALVIEKDIKVHIYR